MDRADRDLDRLSPLAEPLRRGIYLYVAGKRADVSRDEVASALGIGRSLAAFHLDKLLDEGLLAASYRRLSGRRGPGAGRPAKVYRATGEIGVTVPHRDYELVARLLAGASKRRRPTLGEAVADAAFDLGRSIGRDARSGKGSGRSSVSGRLRRVLAERGYEPYVSRGDIRLRNCPFHALAHEYRDTVCPMNLALIRGMLDGLGADPLEAIPQQVEGECCVAIASSRAPANGARIPRN